MKSKAPRILGAQGQIEIALLAKEMARRLSLSAGHALWERRALGEYEQWQQNYPKMPEAEVRMRSAVGILFKGIGDLWEQLLEGQECKTKTKKARR